VTLADVSWANLVIVGFTKSEAEEGRAIVAIESLAVIAGDLPPRVRGLVVEWAALHRQELREAWNLAVQHQPLKPIAPLE
jgi:hypothetical protein